ncbi:hypothetical protein HOO68_06205, partial [Candidatus Gracilibacteria bacterium]|nr:hypothetical protein [Candidatus Gracilibacteria bacterium]
ASDSLTSTLPSGISISESTGKILSTSLGAFVSTCLSNSNCPYDTYKIEVYNQLGSAFYLIKMRVLPEPAPTSFNYPLSLYEFRTLTVISNINPLFPTGSPNCLGTNDCFSINPPLPSGIEISHSSGQISGIPTKNSKQVSTSYVVTANDSRGLMTSTPFSISVKERIPVFNYAAGAKYSFKKSQIINDTEGNPPRIDNSLGFEFTPSCGANAIPITSFSISPNLPSGLTITNSPYQCGDASITNGGTIHGTPTSYSSNTTYTITGCNDGGCGTTTIEIDISPYFSKLKGGESHACSLVRDAGNLPAQMMCWGANDKKQLGETLDQLCLQPNSSNINCNVQAKYIKNNGNNLTNLLDISTGKNHTCAIVQVNPAVAIDGQTSYFANGNVLCWGDNQFNQIGLGSAIISTPQQVLRADNDQPLNTAYSLTSGGDDTCALVNDEYFLYDSNGNQLFHSNGTPQIEYKEGNLYCWGKNYGAKAQKIIFNASDSVNFYASTSVQLGESHGCSVLTKFIPDSENPGDFLQEANGERVHCWGLNDKGQLGNNQTSLVFSLSPVKVLDSSLNELTGISSVISGGKHSCAYTIGSPMKCWGDNEFGQVKGSIGFTNYSTAQLVNGINGIGNYSTQLTVGINYNSTYVYGSDGTYKFFGKIPLFGAPYLSATSNNPSNILFNYGDGSFSPFAGGGSSMIGSSSKDFYCDSLINNGNLYCWGKNNVGQLGTNTLIDSIVPSRVFFDYN